MIRIYFLIISIILTIYIYTFNILFFQKKYQWCKYTMLRIKLIYYTIWNWICAIYIYIIYYSPDFNEKYLFEYLILGAAFHILAIIYGYRSTFI